MTLMEEQYDFIKTEMELVFDQLAEKYLATHSESKDSKRYLTEIFKLMVEQMSFTKNQFTVK